MTQVMEDRDSNADENSRSEVRIFHPGPIQATYTPDWLAKDMVALANIKPTHDVLEPSAGYGALASEMFNAGIDLSLITCIELNEAACGHLSMLGFNPIRFDFLNCHSNPIYDRVVMNPPSLHALGFLKRGGRLVALIVNRFLTGDSEEERKLRIVMETRGRLYQIAYPSFAIKDQKIDAAILVIDV